MSASFVLTLDTQPPADPTLTINAGAPLTGTRLVKLTLGTADYQGGAADVSNMKVWGDVDLTGDLAIQATESASAWLPFSQQIAALLSTGSGRKHLYARMRDSVGNETLPVTTFIDLDTTMPMVEIVTGVDRSRVSTAIGFDTATFTWQATSAFLAYQVRIVPSHAAPYIAGVPLGATNGSVNILGTGTFAANAPITTTVRGRDLAAASPGSTTKVVKVFVQRSDGVWSP